MARVQEFFTQVLRERKNERNLFDFNVSRTPYFANSSLKLKNKIVDATEASIPLQRKALKKVV